MEEMKEIESDESWSSEQNFSDPKFLNDRENREVLIDDTVVCWKMQKKPSRYSEGEIKIVVVTHETAGNTDEKNNGEDLHGEGSINKRERLQS